MFMRASVEPWRGCQLLAEHLWKFLECCSRDVENGSNKNTQYLIHKELTSQRLRLLFQC